MEHALPTLILEVVFFVFIAAAIQAVIARYSYLPYTVALLITGAFAQLLVKTLGFHTTLTLTPEFIFYILLPALLFESAFQMNIHAFRLQFKTITWVATFGLAVSVVVTGYALHYFTGMPLNHAMLFGAIISATDPIAVIAVFKTLGAPRRLTLLADGESMLNDATGVIAFKVVSAFVIGSQSIGSSQIFTSVGNFFYVFIGSIVLGLLIGILFSNAVGRVRSGILENAFTVVAALGSFAFAEHVLHLSGVITTVITALVMGNLGATKFTAGVKHFVQEFWGYFGFLAISLVFFFATFTLNFSLLFAHIPFILGAIAAVLIARSVSVYLSFYITNKSRFFKDEPDVPLSWQHILNWGGLRGVIPLVLVYSLPDGYPYKDLMISLTMGVFLFTLFVNGTSIRLILKYLRIDIPLPWEAVQINTTKVMEKLRIRESLKRAKYYQISKESLKAREEELNKEASEYLKSIVKLPPQDAKKGLLFESLIVEKEKLEDLFEKNLVTEDVYHLFNAELDLQLDAVEFPELNKGRAYKKGGKVNSRASFRKTMGNIKEALYAFPLFKNIVNKEMNELIYKRIDMLQVRIATSNKVKLFFSELYKECNQIESCRKTHIPAAINELLAEQEALIERNLKEIEEIRAAHPFIMAQYEADFAKKFSLKHTQD